VTARSGIHEKAEEGERRCWCAGLWRAGTGDIWKLERAAAGLTAELDAAERRERERELYSRYTGGASARAPGALFAAFDPAVHRGGEWSAVYLWRNGGVVQVELSYYYHP
jgi:hypothetical protein